MKNRDRGRNRLRVLRAEQRISQMDVAEQAGLNVNRYWRIENGYVQPTPSERRALSRLFRVIESEIFPGLEKTEASA